MMFWEELWWSFEEALREALGRLWVRIIRSSVGALEQLWWSFCGVLKEL